MTKKAATPAAPAAAKVTMTDGREVDFGKKHALFNISHDESGVHLAAAFSDGEYRDYTTAPDVIAEWAAYGLRAFAKAQNLISSKDFDEKVLKWGNGPDISSAPTETPALPIEQALVVATGKTLEAVKAFLSGKSRKEVNALKAEPRIAPLYAAYQAAALAAAQARKDAKAEAPVAPVDLLAALVDEPVTDSDGTEAAVGDSEAA